METQDPQDTLTVPDMHKWKSRAALFLISQGITLFGSSLVMFAIIWHITLTTKSGVMLTISTLCGFLPQVLISVFAGVWADRYNRKLLVAASDSMIAISTLILALLFLNGYDELWLLFVMSAIRSVGAGIQSPSASAMISQLVPQEDLMRFNGLMSGLQSVILLASPAAGGLLLSLFTIETAFLVDVFTAIIGITILLTLKIPLHQKASENLQADYLGDLKAGLRYMQSHRYIKNLLLFYSVFFFLITPCVFLTPLMVARSFGEEVWRLTLNEMMFSGGTILGGFAIAAWGGFKDRAFSIAISCTAFGLLTIALGLSKVFWLYLAVMLVYGIFLPFFNSAGNVVLQERVDADFQGRIFGLVQLVITAVMPLGMIVCGPLANVISVELQLVVSGVLITILGFIILKYRKSFV